MNVTTNALLSLSSANLLSFAVIAIIGIARGVTDPFPAWFRDGSDICFFLGLILTFVSLPFAFVATARQGKRAIAAATVAFGTVMVIAFLTTRG
jgi:hypothetical protein